ncbi:unnamed protein product [Pleuronectes platessa]|uniref:Uncharacterized protein n=1 Tax=Pleuronectes platessa TaxID=8262 RepID=A0A9N7V853_PLEPL|nr:unnamed protein product [Pleuronectes platessa]
MIASKKKLVKIALDRPFTQVEYDVMVVAMSKLSLASAARSHGDADMVERKFLFGGAASAASGRSAGTKWKRQVEHGKGPEEKKARREVTQPAHPPASAASGRSAGTKCKRQDEQETSEMIASKRRKCIKEALDNAFTQDERRNDSEQHLDQLRTTERGLEITFPPIVKSRRPPAPKAPTDYYHNMDPFTRRRTPAHHDHKSCKGDGP